MLANDEKIEGAYLHYDEVNLTFIRSGKAVGADYSNAGIMNRNRKHFDEAKKSRMLDGVNFYTRYPSRSNENTIIGNRGYFEDLNLLVGMGFDREKSVGGLIMTQQPTDEDSRSECVPLFEWIPFFSKIEAQNLRGCTVVREKQLVLLGYYFEYCYDLCIASVSNVSNNVGFEAIIGPTKKY